MQVLRVFKIEAIGIREKKGRVMGGRGPASHPALGRQGADRRAGGGAGFAGRPGTRTQQPGGSYSRDLGKGFSRLHGYTSALVSGILNRGTEHGILPTRAVRRDGCAPSVLQDGALTDQAPGAAGHTGHAEWWRWLVLWL